MNKVISAGGLIVIDDKILLVKLKSGKYAIPKGHSKAGETIEQTALREVTEETGVVAEIQDYLGELTRKSVEDSGDTVMKTIKVYAMKKVGMSEVESDEESEWVSLDEAVSSMHFSEEADFLKQHLGKLQSTVLIVQKEDS